MRETYLNALRCPQCYAEESFALAVQEHNQTEVRKGTLICRECNLTTKIDRGVIELLHGAPEHVSREAAGLERFAEQMKRDGWDRKRVLGLPFGIEHGYWYVQAISHDQLLRTVNFQPGESVLDVGSNTCWASNSFAERKLIVTALDISLIELQGLYTADWFFEAKPGVFFERILGSMLNIPLASASLDYVYCCEVLHHNSPHELATAFTEMYRVLKPGGKLLVINEPLRFPFNLKRDHGKEVAEFEGNENVYFFHEYITAAKRAGFRIKVLPPLYHMLFRMDYPDTPRILEAIKPHVLKKKGLATLATLLLFTFGGEVSLNMIGTKKHA
jgi:SAM-dependent methyltransferase